MSDTIIAFKMTREQIIGSVVINFVVGLFLIVMGGDEETVTVDATNQGSIGDKSCNV